MKKLILIVFTAVLPTLLYAQSPEVFSSAAGAIRGYDVVAFFREGKPVIGKKELTYVWNNATWHFASPENLKKFTADPLKYAPQYGGYCAYGVAGEHKSPTETDTWTILNDKLYFNYNQDVKKEWTKNQKELIDKADKNWPVLKKD